MSTSTPHRNLWPDDIAVSSVVPPVAILREQATALANKTRGLIQGEVRQLVPSPDIRAAAPFNYAFRIVAPALGNYRYDLLSVYHDHHLYPLKVTYHPTGQDYQAESEDGFLDALRACFSTEETKRIISALLAQVETE